MGVDSGLVNPASCGFMETMVYTIHLHIVTSNVRLQLKIVLEYLLIILHINFKQGNKEEQQDEGGTCFFSCVLLYYLYSVHRFSLKSCEGLEHYSFLYLVQRKRKEK